MDQPLGVGQQHARDLVAAEAELVRREDEASAADGAAGVALAELGSDDEDVRVALKLGELREHLGRPLRAAEAVGAEGTSAVVVELPRRCDPVDHRLQRFAVGRRELRRVRDGVPSFGPLGHRNRAIDEVLQERLVRAAELREDLAEQGDLLRDALRREVLRVVVLGVEALFLVLKGLDLEEFGDLVVDRGDELVTTVGELLGRDLRRVQPLEDLGDRIAHHVLHMAELGGVVAFISLRRGGARSSHRSSSRTSLRSRPAFYSRKSATKSWSQNSRKNLVFML